MYWVGLDIYISNIVIIVVVIICNALYYTNIHVILLCLTTEIAVIDIYDKY